MNARRERNQYGGNAQVEGHSSRVHRPAAAEGDEREITDVVTALRRDGFDGLFHLNVDNLQNAVGCFEETQAQWSRDLLFECAFGLGFVELHFAAEELVRIEDSGYDICVCDRDVLAAAVVTNLAVIG